MQQVHSRQTANYRYGRGFMPCSLCRSVSRDLQAAAPHRRGRGWQGSLHCAAQLWLLHRVARSRPSTQMACSPTLIIGHRVMQTLDIPAAGPDSSGDRQQRPWYQSLVTRGLLTHPTLRQIVETMAPAAAAELIYLPQSCLPAADWMTTLLPPSLSQIVAS